MTPEQKAQREAIAGLLAGTAEVRTHATKVLKEAQQRLEGAIVNWHNAIDANEAAKRKLVAFDQEHQG